MADIASQILKMNDQEIAADAPLSQALMLKLGANVNGLIDRGNRRVEYKTAGTFQWTTPGDVTSVVLYGCGGGGGGAAGLIDGHAGAGGLGAIPIQATIGVLPNTTYTVTIGAGGAGGVYSVVGAPGAQGASTSFGSLATFVGAPGGLANSTTNNVAVNSPTLFSVGGGPTNTMGANTISATGGTPGVTGGNNGEGGGGGGAGLGNGGAGGGGAYRAPAGTGSPGLQSAGGGGGGAIATGGNPQGNYGNPGNGAAGGPGYLLISY